jgi:hypothetical protein
MRKPRLPIVGAGMVLPIVLLLGFASTPAGAVGSTARLAPSAISSAAAAADPNVLPGTGCPAFPADNVWNTPITGLPVNANSATWLASMSAGTTFLHPDYGPSRSARRPYGLPWQITPFGQPLVPIKFTYASESDPGPYPLSGSTPVESGSDRHALMVDPASCRLYETWRTHYHPGGRSKAGSGAIWSLASNALRPLGWTSADAAGLPILAGLVNYDEARSGTMDHAIRFTAQCTQQAFLWPARHQAGQANPSCPPMGTRFRLNANFSLPASSCGALCQTVLTTMRTYGLILADNGSNWFFQGTADSRWTSADVGQLKAIPASALEAVDETCLMVSPDSGQALQPGTPAFTESCG